MEWKRRCALDLCSENAQADLSAFGARRFHAAVRTCQAAARLRDCGALAFEAREIWHLFETYLQVNPARAGKRYKDWLFARVEGSPDSPLDVIQGGATLLMRTVVREHLRQEYSPPNTVSLNAPLPEAGDESLTFEDLLPGQLDPAWDVEIREFRALAARLAQRQVAEMTPRERVAALAKALGLSLAHPAVEKAAGCRKSVVNAAYAGFVKRVQERIKADFPGEDASAIRLLLILTLGEVHDRVLTWGKSEKSCAHFFLLI